MVVQNTSAASGVAARPPTAVQIHVDMTRPDRRPANGPARRRPIHQVSKHVPIVKQTDPMRTPNSLRPKSETPMICIQLTNGGFSTRRAPLYVGTIQSPESSIANVQAAFLGSSSSQSGAEPSPGKRVVVAEIIMIRIAIKGLLNITSVAQSG